MDSVNVVYSFLTQNVKDIVILVLSILAGFAVNYVFYVRQKKDTHTVLVERTQRARSEVVDTVESLVISKQPTTARTIANLLPSIDRKYGTNLAGVVNPIDILQDTSLRLQQSRHLDVAQKQVYVTGLEQLIDGTRMQTEATPSEQKTLELLTNLESVLKQGESDTALKIVNELKTRVQQFTSPPPGIASLNGTSRQWVYSLLTTLSVAVAANIAASLVEFRGSFYWIVIGSSAVVVLLLVLRPMMFPKK